MLRVIEDGAEQKLALAEARNALLTKGVTLKNPAFHAALAAAGGVGLLALVVPLDVAIPAAGFVVNDTAPGPIVAGISGTIEEILVRPRQKVNAGELLVRIKPPNAEAESAARARRILLQERLNEISIIENALNSGSLAGVNDEVIALRAKYQQTLDKVSATKDIVASTGATVTEAERALRILSERIETIKSLADRGYASKSRVTDFEYEYSIAKNSLESSKSAHTLAISNAKSAQLELMALIPSAISQYKSERRQVSDKLLESDASISQYGDAAERQIAKSPLPGFIEGSDGLFVGKSVTQGDVLFKLTPTADSFTVRLYVSNDMVSHIRTGDKVVLKLKALRPGRLDRPVDGVVKHISESAEPLPEQFLVLPTEARPPQEFAVDVNLKSVPPSEFFTLKDGMRATGTILTGRRRSAMQYIANAVRSRGFRPFSEPQP